MLVQPIFSPAPVPADPVFLPLTIRQFLDFLREEEDYFDGEQHRTKLMTTRLRKIFYDQWGWNSELIRGAASVEMRYVVEIVDTPTPQTGLVTRYQNYEYTPKSRLTTYRPDDRIFGNKRAGQTPPILVHNHQEVRLEDGLYCDLGHVLAGLDAFNHFEVVSPLHHVLLFLKKLVPHVDSNADIVTWLGDIASSSGDFLFDYLRTGKRPLTDPEMQKHIDEDAPGSDMLGDIDPFVIRQFYEIGAENGQRPSEILADYYAPGNPFAARRASYFCQAIGLKNWDGAGFSNENQWLRYYEKQLRDNITFQIFSLTNEKLRSVWLPLKVWFGCYKPVLKKELLLKIFLKSLKTAIHLEPKTA